MKSHGPESKNRCEDGGLCGAMAILGECSRREMSADKGVKGQHDRVCWIRFVKSGTVNEIRCGFVWL